MFRRKRARGRPPRRRCASEGRPRPTRRCGLSKKLSKKLSSQTTGVLALRCSGVPALRRSVAPALAIWRSGDPAHTKKQGSGAPGIQVITARYLDTGGGHPGTPLKAIPRIPGRWGGGSGPSYPLSCLRCRLSFELLFVTIRLFSNGSYHSVFLTTFSDGCLGSNNDEGRSEV